MYAESLGAGTLGRKILEAYSAVLQVQPDHGVYPRIWRTIVRLIQLMQKYNKRVLKRSLRAKGADLPKYALPGGEPQHLRNP